MSTCCSTIEPVGTRTYRIALAGNPNSGKTTLFNALTGLRAQTVVLLPVGLLGCP